MQPTISQAPLSGIAPDKTKSSLQQMVDQNIDDRFNGFLKMFLASIQRPNPENPPDAMQMSTNLMGFIHATEQSKTNHLLAQMNKHQSVEMAMKSKSYLNKEVDFLSNQLSFTGEEEKISFTLPYGIQSAALLISDSKGKAIASLPIESKAGRQTVTWDGKNDNGATVSNGLYEVQLIAADEQHDKPVLIPTYLSGIVSEYGIAEDGDVTYYVKGLPVSLSAISRVREDGPSVRDQLNQYKNIAELLEKLNLAREEGV